MATHGHIGFPCTICGFPLEGDARDRFMNKNNTRSLVVTPLASIQDQANEDMIFKQRKIINDVLDSNKILNDLTKETLDENMKLLKGIEVLESRLEQLEKLLSKSRRMVYYFISHQENNDVPEEFIKEDREILKQIDKHLMCIKND